MRLVVAVILIGAIFVGCSNKKLPEDWKGLVLEEGLEQVNDGLTDSVRFSGRYEDNSNSHYFALVERKLADHDYEKICHFEIDVGSEIDVGEWAVFQSDEDYLLVKLPLNKYDDTEFVMIEYMTEEYVRERYRGRQEQASQELRELGCRFSL